MAIEVKKYNTGPQKSYGPLENETIALHLGDRLKYESLDILQRHFDCELYMLFYPVTQERIVKFEKIDRLKSRMSAVLPLPRVDSDDSLQEFQTRFFAFMCSVIGNSTSSGWKVFHTNYRCKYIPANAQKTSIFASRQEAMKAGYRICTACQRSNPWV